MEEDNKEDEIFGERLRATQLKDLLVRLDDRLPSSAMGFLGVCPEEFVFQRLWFIIHLFFP